MNSENQNKWISKVKEAAIQTKSLAGKCKEKLACILDKAKESSVNIDILNRIKKASKAFTDKEGSFVNLNRFSKLYANKKLFYTYAGVAGVLVIAGVTYFSTLSYEVYIDGERIGIVGSKSDVYKVVEDIKKSVPKEFGDEIKIGQSIEMKSVHVSKAQLLASSQLESSIKAQIDVQADAFGINVDGDMVAVLKTQAQAEEALKKIKQPYESSQEGVEKKEIEFVQNVKIEKVQANIADIKTSQAAVTYLIQGTEKLQTYEIKSGDSAWTVARALDIHVADIEKANPEVDVEKLQIGQKINVTVPKPYISVRTIEDVTYEEKIPYEVVYEDTNAMYKGDKKVKAEGHEGLKKVKAKQIKVDGVLASTQIINEEVMQNPKSKVIVQGVKERPKTLAFGSFINPTRGRLTSTFGSRWGRMHTGIDIANSIGTPIYAADGGKVSYAGWKSGYGKLIIINHENGYQTYYGHCSSIDVSTGSRVYRGQKIGAIGNTGRSTGPHLHFEVRKNGTPQNPTKYVGY